MYSPTIPILIKIRLPKNQIDNIIDGQPDNVGCPKYEIKTYSATITSNTNNTSPVKKIHIIGRAENEVIPSIEKLNFFFSGYFDSPATRSFRSYFTISVFKPI